MKVAFILSGQPRFTPDILDIVNKVQGFDHADLYAVFWKSEWATTDEEARARLAKILPNNWSIGEVRVVDEPGYTLPEDAPKLEPLKPENILWWYQRSHSQVLGMHLAMELVPRDQYHAVIRIRGDCSPDKNFLIDDVDFGDKIVTPQNILGWEDQQFNDQFFYGSEHSMRKLLACALEFPRYVTLSDPNWASEPHGRWRGEWLIGTFLRHTGIGTIKGPFNVRMNTYGRSKFTDKHYHHGIAPDPTQ